MARRTKLTKDVKKKLYEAIEAGCTYNLAAQYAGIGESTLMLWMKQGREAKDKNKLEFLEEIKRAESKGCMKNLVLIQQAAAEDWKAAAWILERRHQYNRNQQNRTEEKEAPAIVNDTRQILNSQLQQSITASNEALRSGSYQAFAALQRQTVNIALQLKILDAENMGDDESANDEQMLEQISAILAALPPVLKQRLQEDILASTVAVKGATILDS